MARTTARRKRFPQPKIPADPRLLSAKLPEWAGERIARSGRKYALLGRVSSLQLSPDGKTVDARVLGDRPAPYQVLVQVQDGRLLSRCTCDDAAHLLCKHAVAALETLRFPLPSLDESTALARRRRNAGRLGFGRGRVIQQAPLTPGFVVLGRMARTLTREERLSQTRKQELQARRDRARRERAEVKRLPSRPKPPRFRVTGKGAPYIVTLRGPKADLPSCTCPDFVKNELGTCKHIERAKGWFSRRKRRRLPENVLSVWWRPRVWDAQVPDPLQEIRLDLPLQEIPRSLRRHFDDDGWMRPASDGRRPSEFVHEAIAKAERVARRHGWTWDLDPAVDACLDSAAVDETTAEGLSALSRTSRAWQEVVPHLGLKLHPYQERGVLFLARRGRAFLADDMGLGKTVQAIAAALLLRRVANAGRALVVCPASLKHQWRREIHKTCREQSAVVEDRRSVRLAEYERWSKGFLILNYELVLRDLEAIQAARPDLVILDEAQRIKNWDTKTAKAVKQLQSPHAFILTGTPLENRLGELHSLVEFLYPRALGPRWRLLPFHSLTDPQGRVLAYEGLGVLRKRLRGFFLRRERKQVLEQLPERTENTFWTEMTPAQRRPYRKQVARVASLLSRNRALRSSEVRALLQALTSMRILCNALAQHAWREYGSQVLDGSFPNRAEVRALGSPKLEEFEHVLEDLLEESDSKIVVFSQWERMLRLARFVTRELLEQRGERSEVFHGGLSGPARNQLLEQFRQDPELRVLFSTDAGGQGLNLQESASVVVNLEVPWNPAVLEQRIGRVHRIGQRKSVQVLHFVTRGAIEERVRQVVESKRRLFEGLLVDELEQVVLDPNGRSSFVERIRELIE